MSTPFAYRHYGYHENREFYDSLNEKGKQVWDNIQKIRVGKYVGPGRYRINIEDQYDAKLKYFLDERISEIESELEAIDDYKRNIDFLYSYLKQENFNQAFNYYIKALSYKDKIKNKDHFLDEEKEKKIENGVKNILLNLSIIIKRTVLDLGTKFTRLEIREISEKCNVDNEDLIIEDNF